jgi:hypothetical protein
MGDPNCARRVGADLYTFNRDDFALIRRHKAIFSQAFKAVNALVL